MGLLWTCASLGRWRRWGARATSRRRLKLSLRLLWTLPTPEPVLACCPSPSTVETRSPGPLPPRLPSGVGGGRAKPWF